ARPAQDGQGLPLRAAARRRRHEGARATARDLDRRAQAARGLSAAGWIPGQDAVLLGKSAALAVSTSLAGSSDGFSVRPLPSRRRPGPRSAKLDSGLRRNDELGMETP